MPPAKIQTTTNEQHNSTHKRCSFISRKSQTYSSAIAIKNATPQGLVFGLMVLLRFYWTCFSRSHPSVPKEKQSNDYLIITRWG